MASSVFPLNPLPYSNSPKQGHHLTQCPFALLFLTTASQKKKRNSSKSFPGSQEKKSMFTKAKTTDASPPAGKFPSTINLPTLAEVVQQERGMQQFRKFVEGQKFNKLTDGKSKEYVVKLVR